MNYTIKNLKDDIKHGWKETSEIIVDKRKIKGLQSLDNGNLYISTYPKIGNCNLCGHAVYVRENFSGINEYIGYCPNCNMLKTEF